MPRPAGAAETVVAGITLNTLNMSVKIIAKTITFAIFAMADLCLDFDKFKKVIVIDLLSLN